MFYEPMRWIRLRCWLPVANLAIDGVLLGMMPWAMHDARRSEKEIWYEKHTPRRTDAQAAIGWEVQRLVGATPGRGGQRLEIRQPGVVVRDKRSVGGASRGLAVAV